MIGQAVMNSRWETIWTTSTVGPPVGEMFTSILAMIVVDAASLLAPHSPWAGLATASQHHRLRQTGSDGDDRKLATHRSPPRYCARFLHALAFGGCLVASTPLMTVLMLRELGFSPTAYGVTAGVPYAAGVLGSLNAPMIIRRTE